MTVVNETEFDKFAAEYREMHAANIRITGEAPEYFAEYKVADVAELLRRDGIGGSLAMLDFGGGIGVCAPYFRRYFPEAHVTCLDVSRLSLEVGESLFGDSADFVHFDGRTVPFPDESFDVAFLACVLHHIPHEEHAETMRELHRVLKPGGALTIFEHNPYNPLTRRAVNTCPFDENAVLVSPSRLKATVAGEGFIETAVDFRIFFPHALRRLRGLERYMTKLPLGGQYRVHARKAPVVR